MFGRISALFLLALALVKTLLARLGPGRPLEHFAQHYGAEGIQGVSASEAKLLARAGACTACGRCDQGEGERVSSSERGYRGLMAFVLAGTRSLPDYSATARTIADVPEEAFEAGERECPEGVPLVELARLIRGHTKRGEAQGAPTP